MLDDFLREVKERSLYFVAIHCKQIDPTLVTIIGGIFGVFCAFFAYVQYYKMALLFWFVNRIIDGLDGVIARVHKKQSDFGGYLDIYIDFWIYCLVPIGIVAGNPNHVDFVLLALTLTSYMVNGVSWMFLSALLESKKASTGSDVSQKKKLTSIVMPSGLIEGTETIIAYSIVLMFPQLVRYFLSIFSLLVFITSFQRVYWAYKNI